MVESSDARHAALDGLIDGVVAGGRVDHYEGQLLDCKEDPSRRGKSGTLGPGDPTSNELATTVADAAVCFANADGGVVIVGVNDKAVGSSAFVGTPCDTSWLQNRIRQLVNLEVQVKEKEVVGTRIVIVTVEPSAIPLADSSGKYRRRQGRDCHMMTGIELGRFSVHRSGADWSAAMSSSGVANADQGALSQLRVWLRETGESSRLELADRDDLTLLHQLGLCAADGTLNRAGELLCVSLPGRGVLIDCIIRSAPGADTELRIEQADAPLALTLAEVESALRNRNPSYPYQSHLTVGQIKALPELALREALINASMHRDWAAQGPVRVVLEGTTLTVSNPGGFLPGVTADTVITAEPRTRNAQLAKALRSLRLAEAEGIGVDRMYRETVRQGLPTPDIEEFSDGDGVLCVLTGGPPDTAIMDVVSSLPTAFAQDIDVLLLFHLLLSVPSVNATQLAPVIQKSRTQATAAIERAVTAGLVVLSSQAGYYRLADRPRRALAAKLPYLRRTEADYAVLLFELLSRSGTLRARDLIDACDINSVRASQVLAQAVRSGLLQKHGAMGAGVYYTLANGHGFDPLTPP